LGAAVLVCSSAPSAHAQAAFSSDDTLSAIDQASADTGISAALLRRIVRCETGGTFNPYAVGDHGTSFGAVQLHRPGLYWHFLAVGYLDPDDPYQAVEYLARVLRGDFAGLSGSRWSCY
jgi:hypothetical protein